MVSNLLLIYSLILFLGAQPSKSFITVDATTCGTLQNDVQSSVAEMIDMSSWAYARTVGGNQGTLSAADKRVTFNTYQSYFGINGAQARKMVTSNLLSRL